MSGGEEREAPIQALDVRREDQGRAIEQALARLVSGSDGTYEITDVRLESHQGPVPHPDSLVKYEAVVPGSAALFFQMLQRNQDMAEREQAHRHGIENRTVAIAENVERSNAYAITRGQIFALMLGLIGIVLAGLLAMRGQATAAVLTFLSSLLVMAIPRLSASFRERRAKKKPDEEKGEAESSPFSCTVKSFSIARIDSMIFWNPIC